MPDYFLKKKNLDFKPKRGGRLAVNGKYDEIHKKLRFLHLYLLFVVLLHSNPTRRLSSF